VTQERSGGGPPRWLLAVVAATLAAVLGLVVGFVLARPDGAPSRMSVDVGFSRDMQAHHGQAVQMAELVRDRSEDDELRLVALDILLTQQQQIGQMYAWLDLWGHPQSDAQVPQAWAEAMGGSAGHGGHAGAGSDAAMPGMASDADMVRLRDSQGVDAERLFLQLMIAHHRGGVEMAEVAADKATQPRVRRLAQAMVDGQTAEIVLLQRMLDERGGPPA